MSDVSMAAGPVAGDHAEADIANDLVRRGLLLAPVALLVGLLTAGIGGALSVAFALALVLVNFRASAALLGWAARVSLSLVMGVALFGFLVRVGLVSLAVWLVRDLWWVHPLPLGITVIVAHLGLLAWEARYVSASLAFPGLKPGVRTTATASPIPTPHPDQEQSA